MVPSVTLAPWQHPTGGSPESVTIVSLGPTNHDWIGMMTSHEPEIRTDETWTLNTGLRWCPADLVFVMDDLRWYSERYPAYGRDLRAAKVPIITSQTYPDFPRAVAYPIVQIAESVGSENAYWHNSVPYMLAYALWIGVKRVYLFGADYTFPGSVARESGRANCEYWVGFLRARGVSVIVPSTTTLLDTRDGPQFYGYLYQPILATKL